MPTQVHKIVLVSNPKYKASGLRSYGHLMRKWNFTPTKPGPLVRANKIKQQGKFGFHKSIGGHAHVQQKVLKKVSRTSPETGEVSAEDIQYDSMYLCEVRIGTSAQKLKLDFDTGSSDLWVWSTELPVSIQKNAGSHTLFNPSKSSTFKKKTGFSWKIGYGDGSSASGDVGTDVVNIGGITIKAQAVELAKQMSYQFQQSAGDGLLGLAWSSINTVRPQAVKTPVDNMIAQDDIPESMELFTAKLGSWRDANEPDKGAGFYTFGMIDHDTMKAADATEPYYTPVDNSQGFWMFNSTSMTVNGETYQRSGNTAIADTGTTLALVDDETCERIYSAIPGATYDYSSQGWIYPSKTTVKNLPIVTFDVGGKQFQIQKEDLGFVEAKKGYTYGGIQSRGSLSFDILGDTFLKGVYAIFDVGKQRFGCVARPEKYQNITTPSD